MRGLWGPTQKPATGLPYDPHLPGVHSGVSCRVGQRSRPLIGYRGHVKLLVAMLRLRPLERRSRQLRTAHHVLVGATHGHFTGPGSMSPDVTGWAPLSTGGVFCYGAQAETMSTASSRLPRRH